MTTCFYPLGKEKNHKKEAQKKYRRFANDLIGKEYESPLKETVASTILGREGFIKEITGKYIGKKKKDRNLPALKKLSRMPSIEDIMNKVKTAMGEDENLTKSVSIYLCHKYSGARLKEIGARFGIGESAVSQARRRFVIEMAKDNKLKKAIEKVEGELIVSRV